MTDGIDSSDRQTLDTYDMKAVDDTVHEDRKTLVKGKPLEKEKYRGTIEAAENDRPVQRAASDVS
jgi:hypothetical protein